MARDLNAIITNDIIYFTTIYYCPIHQCFVEPFSYQETRDDIGHIVQIIGDWRSHSFTGRCIGRNGLKIYIFVAFFGYRFAIFSLKESLTHPLNILRTDC